MIVNNSLRDVLLSETTRMADTMTALSMCESDVAARPVLRSFLDGCTRLELMIIIEALIESRSGGNQKGDDIIGLLFNLLVEQDAPKTFAAMNADPERN